MAVFSDINLKFQMILAISVFTSSLNLAKLSMKKVL